MIKQRQMTGAVIVALAVLVLGGTVLAGGDRLECRNESALGDSSMDAEFESDKGRMKFSASFETAPGGGLQAGDVLQIRVGSAVVGMITLAAEANGDLGGDLNFDSTAGPDDDDSPFPANWTGAGAGTTVSVGTMGCSLQSR